MFRVVGTDTYLLEIAKFSKAEQDAARKIHQKLAENPRTGKLLFYPNLREKRIEGKRVYYFSYDDLKLVLMVATSGKKDQQDTIDHIRENILAFRKAAEEIVKRGPESDLSSNPLNSAQIDEPNRNQFSLTSLVECTLSWKWLLFAAPYYSCPKALFILDGGETPKWGKKSYFCSSIFFMGFQ